MAQGVKLSSTQIEIIESAWIMTGNKSFAAKQAGCSHSAASRYIDTHAERLGELREQKKPSTLDMMQNALQVLVGGLTDEQKIKDAPLRDVAMATGILVDKIQLLSGEATVRTETRSVNPEDVLTPEEREQAARIRAKLAGEAVPA